MTRWDYRKYGTKADPIRQSDLAEIAGTYGCGRRFAFRKDLEAAELEREEVFSSRRSIGSGVHDTIATYLQSEATRARIFGGELPSPDAMRLVLEKHLGDELGSIEDSEIEEAVCMVRGALAGIVVHAEEILLCEAEFLAELEAGDRSYWLKGTVDIVYVPRGKPGQVGLADWKTGQQKIHPIILSNGYQFACYSHALAKGVFVTGPDSTRSIGQHPDEIFAVHLRDHVPYKKAGTKGAERQEEADFYGVERGAKVKYAAGQDRGPGWYRADRSEEQVARLAHSIRTLVGVVRRGGFVESIGEHCARCPYKGPCLSDGYGVQGDERSALEKNLRGLVDTDDGLAA